MTQELVTALITGGLAVIAVLVSQFLANRRADSAERRSDARLEAERVESRMRAKEDRDADHSRLIAERAINRMETYIEALALQDDVLAERFSDIEKNPDSVSPFTKTQAVTINGATHAGGNLRAFIVEAHLIRAKELSVVVHELIALSDVSYLARWNEYRDAYRQVLDEVRQAFESYAKGRAGEISAD